MLEFWFNQTIPIFKRLVILLVAILIAIGTYFFAPMPPALMGLFMMVGVIFIICRLCKKYLTNNDPRKLLYRLFTWIPLALLCAVIFMKALDHLLEWGIQGIAIMVITICICSPQVFKRA